MKLIVLAMVATLAGCGAPQSPATRLHQAKATYVVAIQTVDRLANAGKLSPDQARKLAAAIRYVDTTLAVAEAAEKSGGDIDAILAELGPAIDLIIGEAAKAEAK